MNESQWLQHKLLNVLQSALLVALPAFILGLLGWILGGPLIAGGAALMTVLSYFLNPVMAPHMMLRMYGGRMIYPREAPQLYDVLRELAERGGLPQVPVLYYLPSNVMNAFATGHRNRPAIGLSNALLQRMNLRELAGVLAHEVSHLRHEDIRIMTFADIVTRLTHLLSMLGQIYLLLSLPLLILGDYRINWLPVLLMIFAPFISALLQLALSRTREFNADLGAAELLGSPLPLAEALVKMEYYQGRWVEQILLPWNRVPEPSLLRTHPPTQERIERLLELQGRPNLGPAYEIPVRHERPGFVSTGSIRPRRRFIWGLWY